MVCHDDHLLGPGAGFPDHPHREPRDRHLGAVRGARARRRPRATGRGRARHGAVLSAGAGVVHAEVAHRRRAEPVRPGRGYARTRPGRSRRTPRRRWRCPRASWCRSPRVTSRTRGSGSVRRRDVLGGPARRRRHRDPARRRRSSTSTSPPGAGCGRRLAEPLLGRGRVRDHRPGAASWCRRRSRPSCWCGRSRRPDGASAEIDERARQHLDHGRLGASAGSTPSGSPSPPTGIGCAGAAAHLDPLAGQHGDLVAARRARRRTPSAASASAPAATAASITTTSSTPSSTVASGAIFMPLP